MWDDAQGYKVYNGTWKQKNKKYELTRGKDSYILEEFSSGCKPDYEEFDG